MSTVRNRFRRLHCICSSALLLVTLCSVWAGADEAQNGTAGMPAVQTDVYTYSYADALAEYGKQGHKPASGGNIALDLQAYKAGEGVTLTTREMDGKAGLLLDESVEEVSWTVDIPSGGLYTVGFDYFPLEGSGLNIQRTLLIDGKLPFAEATFPLYRRWVDKSKPEKNNIGDEVKPRAKELPQWLSAFAHDSLGKYALPLQFYFSAGQHSITLKFVDQPVLISGIHLVPPESLPSYESVRQSYPDLKTDEVIRIEAEDIENQAWRTQASAGIETDGDPKVSPPGVTSLRYNIFGGYTWRKGGQTAAWRFKVEKDGLYKLNVRSKQSWGGYLPTYRTVMLDDQIPFEELAAYPFAYNRQWNSEVLRDGENELLFDLKAGWHTISLSPVMGALTDVANDLERAMLALSHTIRRITMITGYDPDPNYEYELTKNVPGFVEELEAVLKLITSCRERADEIGRHSTVLGNQFKSIEKQLSEMIKKPSTVSRRLDDLENAITSMGDWLVSIQDCPLSIDYFEFVPADRTVHDYHSSFFEKAWATIENFFVSFGKDYNSVGTLLADGSEITETIDVWVGRGKEWAELIKLLSDSDFTARFGIAVNLNILPSGQIASMGSLNPLLLAISAGNAPDAALGVPSNMPVEYAIRGAVADLSGMEEFSRTRDQLLPAIITPFEYGGGTWGLPETMNFRCLFYRKDIVNELNIPLPDTWEDLYHKTLPKLYETGMQAYIPHWLDMFLLQNGGAYYTPDGLSSALDTPEAFNGFKQYIETFTIYGAPTSVNFFNRFRTGEIPVGISDFSQYIRFVAAAPELSGRWGILPIPGIAGENGVSRSTAGYVGEAVCVLEGSEKKESAWKFLQWWLSKETQIEYGRDVEGRLGANARWNTSNTEAFQSLPWIISDLEVIKDSWKDVRETPVVLGGYFTSRHISNAWNRCVVSNMSARESLEMCVKDINTELKRRQTQYNSVAGK